MKQDLGMGCHRTASLSTRRFAIAFLILSICASFTNRLNAQGKAPPERARRIVGYLPEYRAADYDLSHARLLTDLIVFSAEPTAEGDLNLDRLSSFPWEQLRTLKTKERLRLILCVGGWARSDHFATVAQSPEKRTRFAKAATAICLARRLDGLDLDWEHPANAAEQNAYGELLAEIRREFAPHGLVLSVTIAGWQHLTPEAIEAADWVNLMSYDHRGRHSTLPAAQNDVKALREMGVPAGKITLGLPFYGRAIDNPDQALTYSQILAEHNPRPNVDEVAGVYFNGPETIRRKAEYARKSGLAGIMIWEVGQDAPGDASLLSIIHSTMQRPR